MRIVQVADADGANAAPLFGTASQQANIFSQIDAIWAQAGIDVDFSFAGGTWNSPFALTGTADNNDPRPTDDLDLIVAQAGAAGLLAVDPLVINLFLVRIVPGFSQTSNNTSNGLAFLDANGITLWAGPALTDFQNGRDAIASVLAHEIGHNLGLDHLAEIENLMQSGGDGERLNAAQIATALASPFSVPIPEPATWTLLGLGGLMVLIRKRSRDKRALDERGQAIRNRAPST